VAQLIDWNQPWAVTVTNTTVTSGGTDIESDDQYRYRVWLAIESFSTCGPHDAYEFWALSADPSIIQCVVYSSPDIAGEVHLFPLCQDANGLPIPPSSDILAKVLTSCSADTKRPVTDYVTAYAPTPFNYSCELTYYVSELNEVLLGSIQLAVTQAVNDWVTWQGSYIGRDINTDELSRRCLEAGAKRIVVTTPTPGYQALAYNELATLTAVVPGPTIGPSPPPTPAVPIIHFGGIEPE
jgi:phage-related baseplate assembly protein